MSLDRTAIPRNVLDRLLEVERRLDDLEGFAALPVADPEGGDTTYVSIVQEVEIGEGPGIDVTGTSPNQTVGLGGDTILLYDSGGSPVAEFAATDAGLTAGLAAMAAGDVLVLPAVTISGGPWTVAAGTLRGHSRTGSVLDGQVTLADGTVLDRLTLERNEDTPLDIACIVPPGSGIAYVIGCNIACNNATGGGYAVCGDNEYCTMLWCSISAQSAGVDSNPFGAWSTEEIILSDSSDTKCLSLWNGAGNDAPPADWETPGFDDSGWGLADGVSNGGNPCPTDAEPLWTSDPPQAPQEQGVYRQSFTLTKAVTAAHVYFGADDVGEVFINGQSVIEDITGGGMGGPGPVVDDDVDISVFEIGTNVVAVLAADNWPGETPPINGAWVAWRLVLTVSVGTPTVYSCEIPNADGRALATPLHGDRASWRTGYASGATHADDIAGSAFVHHLPAPGTNRNIAVDNGTNWESRELEAADLPSHSHTESDITDLDHTDANAIHDNVAGEIHAIGAKATPVGADELVIEDSEALWVKKRVALSDLPTGASALDDLSDVDAAAPNDGDVLTYDDGSGEWVAAAPTGGSGSGSAASDPVFHVAGALSVATDQNGVWIAPRGATIVAVYIYCRDPGSASSTIVDVNLNGTSIFATTQANRPTLAYDDADQVAKSGAPDTTALVENDVLSIDIDQVATGAEDLTAIVALQVTPIDATDITYTPAVNADWDSDADPGDVDDALDQLAERVDDLEGASSGGNITTAAAEGSEPATPSAGDLFFPTNGLYVKRYSGSIWQLWGPIFPMAPPALGDFTWVNQGTATADDTYGGIHLLAPAVSGDQVRSLVKSAPATPYSIVACFIPLVFNVNYNHVGILWRQSSDGKLIVASFAQDGGISINKFNNSTSWNSSYLNRTRPSLIPVWMKLEDDGTNRVISLSPDGKHWISVHSVSRTDFLTADQVGFYADSNNGTYSCSISLLSWKES